MIRTTNEGIWVIDHDTHFTKWVEEHKRLDTDHEYVVNLIKQYIDGNGAAIDFGANIGTQTFAYTKFFGDRSVIAIEPNPECVECLKRNVPNSIIIQAAVSDKCEEKSLFLQDNVGASYIIDGIGIKTIVLDDCEPVLSAAVTHKPFTFIKMDIEGYEIKALKGGKEFIKKYKPIMWIEVNVITLNRNGSTEDDLLNLITNYGYKYNSFPERGIQYDVLCIPI